MKLIVSGWKEKHCVKWTRTSLLFQLERDDRNKFSLIQTKHGFLFSLVQQQKSQSRGPLNAEGLWPVILGTHISHLHYLNTLVWTAIKSCIAWKLFTLIMSLTNYNTISMICVGIMLHDVISISWLCKQKKKKEFLNQL